MVTSLTSFTVQRTLTAIIARWPVKVRERLMSNSLSQPPLDAAGQRCLDELLAVIESWPLDQRVHLLQQFRATQGASLSIGTWQAVIRHLQRHCPTLGESSVRMLTDKSREHSLESTAASPLTTKPRRPAPESLAGTYVGRYRIDEPLGSGGFGEVWKGFDPELKRTVAIKLRRRDRSFPEAVLVKLLDEARKAASLSHPGIVQVYDITKLDDGWVIVSEYIAGETLARRMKREPVSVDLAVRIVVTIAHALHHAHLRDLIHRDVKPGNILLRTDGTAVLTDFGLAISERELIHEAGEISGTIRYMSPEQARGDGASIDHRSDIFSLGLVLYSLIAGRLPYPEAESSQSYLRAVASRAPRPLCSVVEGLPPGLEQICMRCLAFSPEGRFASARDLAAALEEWQKTSPPGNSVTVQAAPARTSPRLRRIGVGLVASVMALFFAGIILPRMKQYLPGPAKPVISMDMSNSAGDSTPIQAAEANVLHEAGAAPADVLVPTEAWTPLLRTMPQVVSWPTSDGREPPLFTPREQQLTIKSPRSRWVFQCAELEAKPFQMRLVISVDRWEGEAGVMWGLRDAPEAFPESNYRCWVAEFSRSGPHEPAKLVCRNMLLKRVNFDDVRVVHQGTMKTHEIEIPTELSSALEIEVDETGPTIRFGAGQVWRVDDKLKPSDWLPAGRWAVGITGQGQGVTVRSLSLRNRPAGSP